MDKSKIYEHTLANGMKIIGEVNNANKSCAVGFFVNTGARDETPAESGVSHFLEHMMFKGTPKRSSMQITFDMGNIGAQANAYTSQENTVYYSSILPEYLPDIQEILSDMLRPSLDLQEFTTEKNVILEEIALYMDMPHAYLFEFANREIYGEHPLANSVLGSTQSITDLSRDQMKNYFDRRYSPANMTLVVTGDFNWTDFLKRAESLCGHWVNFDTKRAVPAFKMRPVDKVYTKPNLQQTHLLMASPGASATDENRYALSILANIFGDVNGSKLYWELIDTGIADSVSCDHDEHNGAGLFSVYATMHPDKIDKVRGIITKVLANMDNFTDDDLERAKTKILTRIVMNGELPMGRLMALGTTWLYRQELSVLQDIIAKVKAVDRIAIKKALTKYTLSDWSFFVLRPE